MEDEPKVVQFPEGDDWFVWRNNKGELHRFNKGRYAIVKMPDGSYREQYIGPDLNKWEDAILEFGDIESPGEYQVIEKRQINSRRDYEKLLQKLAELNQN